MRNLRSYYSASMVEFLEQTDKEILSIIHSNDISAETTIQQSNTWESEVQILKDQLRAFSDGRIMFEYTIPRMGKRVDTVVLYRNMVFLLEFKVGDKEYRESTYDQVYDYALDLRNFQKESHNKLLVPIMISTKAPRYQNKLKVRDRIVEPLRCNADNIGAAIQYIGSHFEEPAFDYVQWENSEYLPPRPSSKQRRHFIEGTTYMKSPVAMPAPRTSPLPPTKSTALLIIARPTTASPSAS